jgi:hypothetical protein
MSAFDFIAKMGLSNLGQIGNSITKFAVSFDPETASQVEIDNMTAHCRELAKRIADAESVEELDRKTMDDLRNSLTQSMKAAEIVEQQIYAAEAVGDTNKVAMLNVTLSTFMDKITLVGGEEGDGSVSGTLFDAIQNHTQSENDLHEWRQTHTNDVAKLTTARSRLEKAARELAHADEQEKRAKERQAQAERDAGLKKGLGENIALSAMQQAAEEAKKRTRAATINTETIKATTGGNTDDIVAAVLKEASPPVSALDRLKAMQAKKAG